MEDKNSRADDDTISMPTKRSLTLAHLIAQMQNNIHKHKYGFSFFEYVVVNKWKCIVIGQGIKMV